MSLIKFENDNFKRFFIKHLDKIYAAKTLLITELPEIMNNVHFSDLKSGIAESIEDVSKQILRMDEIYRILGESVSDTSSNGLNALIQDSFEDIQSHGDNPELRDMSVLFYLHNIESIEMASFQILEMLTVKLHNERIKQLVKENYDESKADRTLFLLINAKYISSVRS